MKLINKGILISLITISSLFGADNNPLSPQNFIQPSPQQQQGNNAESLQDLKTNQYYLNMDVNDVKNIQKRDRELRDALYQFTQKEINHKPVIRPIASMDTIQLHPYFTMTILLPTGSVVSYIDTSSEMAVLKYENNMIMLRPKSDFEISNLTIVYKLNDTNRVLNILAERYTVELGEKLNAVISYLDIKKRDGLFVLNAYKIQNGKFPTEKYSYIKLDGIDYRIVEDAKYGNISVENKTYRVDNNVIFK